MKRHTWKKFHWKIRKGLSLEPAGMLDGPESNLTIGSRDYTCTINNHYLNSHIVEFSYYYSKISYWPYYVIKTIQNILHFQLYLSITKWT